MVNIYKFCKIFDPTTRRTPRTTSRSHVTQKVRATQNFIKIYSYLWRIFEKNAKKLKLSHRNGKTLFLANLSENNQKIYFYGSCFFNFNFFKNAQEYIDPSGHSRTRFFLQLFLPVISREEKIFIHSNMAYTRNFPGKLSL